MKIRYLVNKIAGAALGLTLLLAVGISASTTSYAQYRNGNNDQDGRDRNWDRYGNYGGSSELRRTALNAGYNEGIKEGRKDRDNGGRTDYANQVTYRRATKGYNSRLGDRELYQRYFREAFEKGYNAESYATSNIDRDGRNRDRGRNDEGDRGRRSRREDGYDNLGGSFQLRQTALNAGFNEGLKQGRNDRSKRQENGYQSQSTYQKATKDYNSRLGDREVYRSYFRKAYENGYADGVSGY